MSPLTLFALLVASTSASGLWAASEAPATRTAAPIVVDGRLGEEEWAGATRVGEFTQFEPRRGLPAREKTEVYVLYDDAYVYFGRMDRGARDPSRPPALPARDGTDVGVQRGPHDAAHPRDELLGRPPRRPLSHLPIRNVDEPGPRNTVFVKFSYVI